MGGRLQVCQTPLFWIILVLAIIGGVYMSLPPPPAKLVLVMFARQNAATKLERNLPLWVRLVDYAVIGVDSASSDSSWNAVSRALHPIPHHIQEVEGFEETGYGEALTPLVEKAFALFPDADAVRSHPLSSGSISWSLCHRFFARVLAFLCCASLTFRGCSAAAQGILAEPDWRPEPRSLASTGLEGWNSTRRTMATKLGGCPLFRFHVYAKPARVPASSTAVRFSHRSRAFCSVSPLFSLEPAEQFGNGSGDGDG